MPYTLIDFTRGFHSLSKELILSAGVRSLYTALVGEFNEARWPERISFSDRELKTLAGLKSVSTVHEAKLVLKNHNLIDFTTTRGAQGRSEYQLRTEHLPNIKIDSTEHYPNNDRTITEHCSRFSVTQNPSLREDERQKTEGGAGARESVSEDVFKVWAGEMPRPLTASEKYTLAEFEETYGISKVKSAIITVRRNRHYPTFADVEKELTSEKGGERREQREQANPVEQSFTVPENPVYIPPALRDQYNEWLRKNSGTA